MNPSVQLSIWGFEFLLAATIVKDKNTMQIRAPGPKTCIVIVAMGLDPGRPGRARPRYCYSGLAPYQSQNDGERAQISGKASGSETRGQTQRMKNACTWLLLGFN